jgi:prepilin-type N-terminal cleavage/methylation domain-containing protein
MEAVERDDSGFSLLELLVVCALLAVTLAAAWTLMNAVSMMSNRMSARATATDESQTFVDTMEDELLQASNLKSFAGTSTANADAQAAFYDIQPREIGFYADLNHDGKPERVVYYPSGVGLVRQQATAANWTGPVFTYYGSGNWPPTQITDPSEVASITVVTIEMRNMATWADQTISYDASSTVRVRAIGNGF